MQNVMIDLETLSTAKNAAIISIGACFFDPEAGEVGKTFYTRISLEDAASVGKVDGSTICWWLQQNDAARAEIVKYCDVTTAEAIGSLRDFIGKDKCVWSNGATFDIVILESAYDNFFVPSPWKHWDVRDVRTILSLARAKNPDFKKGVFGGTEHHALSDAIYQAEYVIRAYRLLVGD